MRDAMKILLLSSLFAVTLLVQNASAAIVKLTDLPDSTYAIEKNNWQGYTYHNQGGFNLRIEFVVYDRENINTNLTDYEAYFVYQLEERLDLTGQYIYAYQIFQYPYGEPGDTADVGYFGILKDGQTINGTDVSSITDNFPLFTDTQEGKEPAENINTPIGWKWDDWDPLATGEESWFLIFSSNFEPVPGDFDIRKPSGVSDRPASGDEIPEPATIALLGIGGAMIFSRRRKSV